MYKLGCYSSLALVNKESKASKAYIDRAYISGTCIDRAYANRACIDRAGFRGANIIGI